jgi:hypothetical protein
VVVSQGDYELNFADSSTGQADRELLHDMLAVAAIAAVVAAPNTYDVVVYGANAGGALAAVAAAQHGAKTALLCQAWPDCFKEGGKRIGGMTTGTLAPPPVPSPRLPVHPCAHCLWSVHVSGGALTIKCSSACQLCTFLTWVFTLCSFYCCRLSTSERSGGLGMTDSCHQNDAYQKDLCQLSITGSLAKEFYNRSASTYRGNATLSGPNMP